MLHWQFRSVSTCNERQPKKIQNVTGMLNVDHNSRGPQLPSVKTDTFVTFYLYKEVSISPLCLNIAGAWCGNHLSWNKRPLRDQELLDRRPLFSFVAIPDPALCSMGPINDDVVRNVASWGITSLKNAVVSYVLVTDRTLRIRPTHSHSYGKACSDIFNHWIDVLLVHIAR